MKRLFADLTDGLFGYRLRYKRWRRWPLLAVLVLIWAPLLLWGEMMLLNPGGADSIARDYLRYKYYYAQDYCEQGPSLWIQSCIGATGQLLVAGVVILFVPLFAARAFAREKAAGNMTDLVLLPVERRRLVLGRLGKVALPFLLLVLWSLPAYLAVPLEGKDIGKYMALASLNAPFVGLCPLAVLFDPGEIDLVIGSLPWRFAGIIPCVTVLSEVFLLATLGFYLSLRLRRWVSAAAWTYLAGAALLAVELGVAFGAMILMRRGWSFQEFDLPGRYVVLGLVSLVTALLVRGLLPLLLLRSAIKNFDRWALGEKKK